MELGSSVAKFNSMELSAMPVPRSEGSDVQRILRSSNFPFTDQALFRRDSYGRLTVPVHGRSRQPDRK